MPRTTLVERLVTGSIWLLVAVIALTMAVELLRGIWPWLVGMAVVIGSSAFLIGLWRVRRRGW